MNILAIDTTSAIASAAVMVEGGAITGAHSDQKMSHLQNLIPMVDKVLNKCQLAINDITHIAISEGPGSFTGIRIGAATAKMLAQVLDIPLIPVPTLMAYAYATPDFKGVICPLLDARRAQVYAAAYAWKNGVCREMTPGGAYGLEEILSLTKTHDDMLYVGDGARVYEERIMAFRAEEKNVLPSSQNCVTFDHTIGAYGLAEPVCKIAYEKLQRGETVGAFSFKPVYMRLAEAQRKLEEK